MTNPDEIPLDDHRQLLTEYRFAMDRIREWKETADLARGQLEDILGEHESGTLDGALVLRWAHTKTTRLDQAMLKQVHPDIFAECQTTTAARRFTLI